MMIHRFTWLMPLLVAGAACSSEAPIASTGFAGTGAAAPIAGSAAPAAPVATPTGPVTTTGAPGSASVGTPTGSATAGSAAPVQTPGAMGGPAPTTPGATENGGMPANCKAPFMEGVIYSPGGEVLPNTCEPFNATTNNPYAVRCVDAWPWYKTKFPGDVYCILPPAPDKGVQYGVHPQGKQWFDQVSKGDMSGYENLAADFVMEDGEEAQANYQTGAPTVTKDMNFYRNYARMRGGSHHMIISTATGIPEEQWGPASTAGLFSGTSLPGAQRPDENGPKSLGKPMEDAGLYSVLPANPSITFNMHHFNATGGQILKEAWVNLWWEDDARIRVYGILGLELTQTATLSVPPGDTQDLHYSWTINEPIRLVTVFGHRHAWTTNFTAWIQEPDGKLEIVYQSFNWLDEPTYRYDSETQNPVPAGETLTDGATSGIRTLMPGQMLHFNCHIEFTDERAAKEMAPSPAEIGTLNFANEAFTAEMCILFGSTAAVQLSTPAVDLSPLPPFATID